MVGKLIRKFAEASCLAMCQKVLLSLPRELRNMVYREIFSPWDNSTVTVSKQFYHSGYITSEKIRPCVRAPRALVPQYMYMFHTRDQGFCRPYVEHCFKAEFVGEQFLRELVEVWYSTITLHFSDTYHILQTFIESKSLIMGLRPANLVKRIFVKVSVEDLATKGSCKGGRACGRAHAECKGVKTLLASLNLLSYVKHRVHVQIEITPILEASKPTGASTQHAKEAHFAELVNTLQSLTESGHNVELKSTAWPAELPTLKSFAPFPECWNEWVRACQVVSSSYKCNMSFCRD